MPYVNSRWLGGTLTNFRTIRRRIARLNQLKTMREDGTFDLLTKKEVSKYEGEIAKFEKFLGGIKDMERLPAALFVVDTRTAAIGSGILTELAVEMAQQGMDAATIVERINTERMNVRVVAMLDTLEYLKRGGRISKTVAFAGNLLAIKPVVNILEGTINMLGKARGSKQANNLLVEEIQKAGGVDFDKPVLLGYTGLSDVLLQKYITDSAALWSAAKAELNVTPIGSVIGTHAGPGAVAVAFFAKN
jgi:DegV family protein with EDD domain